MSAKGVGLLLSDDLIFTSRITATSNAVFTVENMFVWNVLPPCIATVSAILLIGTVSLAMSAGLIVIAGIMLVAMFHLAAAGKPLHDDFADKAAAVDGATTVGDVLDGLYDRYDGLRERIAEDGDLRRFVNVYVGGEDIRFLDGLDTGVEDGDEVTILPAVAGGA